MLRAQLVNVTAFSQKPPIVNRTNLVPTALQSASEHVVCKFKQMDGTNFHLCFPVKLTFHIQLPRKGHWTDWHARSLVSQLFWGEGKRSGRIVYKTPFMGYTMHDPGADQTVPQKLPFVEVTFDNHEQARIAYNTYKTRNGERNPKRTRHILAMWKAWNMSPAEFFRLPKTAFSAHHLSRPTDYFFDRLNDQFYPVRHYNDEPVAAVSLETWFQIDSTKVNWLPDTHCFANSPRNGLATYAAVQKIANDPDSAPLTVASFDVEQYAPRNSEGLRPFPEASDPRAVISHIAVTIMKGDRRVHHVCFCLGGNRIPAKYRDLPDKPKLICYATEAHLLRAFGVFLREQQIDILTGYNIIGYDLSVVWQRAMFYTLCQHPFPQLMAKIQAAPGRLQQFAQAEGWTARRRLYTKLFGRTGETQQQFAPQDWLGLSLVKWWDMEHKTNKHIPFDQRAETVRRRQREFYRYFSQQTQPKKANVTPLFYCGEFPTQRIMYREKFNARKQRREKVWRETGFAIFDAFVFAKDGQRKFRSFKLKDVCLELFEKKAEFHKIDLPYETLFKYIEDKDPDQLGEIAVYCARDALAPIYILQAMKAVGQTRQFGALTRTTFCVQTLSGLQCKLNNKLMEYLHILHFVCNNRIVPEDPDGTYTGGCVIEPTPGFYTDPVGTLDFKSLYPSIIIYKNICPSTMDMDEQLIGQPNTNLIKFGSERANYVTFFTGIVPRIERELLAARQVAKNQMKAATTSEERGIFNCRQLACKVLCNSFYGFWGVSDEMGILPCRPVAKSITSVGRELIVENTQAVCEKLGFQVVYGDTDSVMVLFKGLVILKAWDELLKLETYFAKVVFKNFLAIELEAEKLYWPYLLTDRKKRYAGRMYEDRRNRLKIKMDYKGFELKRGDSAPFIRRIQDELLRAILGMDGTDPAKPMDIDSTFQTVYDILKRMIDQIVKDELPVSDYTFAKQIKMIYKNNPPEQVVANNLRNQRIDAGLIQGEKRTSGRFGLYVVLYKGEYVKKVCDRVEDPEWVAMNHEQVRQKVAKVKKLRIDRLYYLQRLNSKTELLIQYHLHRPTVDRLFAKAAGQIHGQLTRHGNLMRSFLKPTGKMLRSVVQPQIRKQPVEKAAKKTTKNKKRPKFSRKYL